MIIMTTVTTKLVHQAVGGVVFTGGVVIFSLGWRIIGYGWNLMGHGIKALLGHSEIILEKGIHIASHDI